MLEQMFVVMAVGLLALALTTGAVITVITVRRVRRVSRAAHQTCRRVAATITSGRRLNPLRARRQGVSPMSISAFAGAQAALSEQATSVAGDKTPRKRQTVAKADLVAQPEAR